MTQFPDDYNQNQQQQPMPAGQQQSSGAAVASLVLGIISIPTCFCYGLPAVICGPLAIFFSGKAVENIATGVAPASSAGLAKAGKICGIIGTILGVVYIIYVVIMLIVVFANQP